MTVGSGVTSKAHRSGLILSAVPFALAVAVVLAPASALAAGGGPYKPSDAVSFEEIPGTGLKRVILTEKAAERLGIEVGEVSEETIILNQMVGGEIVPPLKEQPDPNVAAGTFGGFGLVTQAAVVEATATSSNGSQNSEMTESDETWVKVTLSEGEWERTRKDQPVKILPLSTRASPEGELLAKPSAFDPVRDMKRTMLKVYYILPNADHGLEMYERVRVELELADSGETRTVVPYSAVYYDGQGKPWVYTNPDSLVFERKPIEIERIVGDWAVIADGPPIGTKVVTVGASLLYGAEVIYKR